MCVYICAQELFAYKINMRKFININIKDGKWNVDAHR